MPAAARQIGPRPAPGRPASRNRQVGFTLIEIVVAFVMLALVLVTSFEIFTGGMRRAGELQEYSRALELAQSKIAAAGTEEPFKEGETQGETEDGHFRWAVAVRRTDEGAPAQGQSNNNPYALFRVDVRVTWAGADSREHSIALATMGLGSRL
ncbi:MAG: type IV pilus modification PilV family protein [Betaproteobacteria bacterium]